MKTKVFFVLLLLSAYGFSQHRLEKLFKRDRSFIPEFPGVKNTVLQRMPQELRMALDSIEIYDGADLDEEEIYKFDTLGRQTEYVYIDYDTAPDILDGEKIVYSYNTLGKLAEEMVYYYYAPRNGWAFDYKLEYYYNVNGLNDSTATYVYNGGWQMDGYDLLTYDASGNVDTVTTYLYDNSTSTFIPDERLIYSYDANNHLTRELFQFYDDVTNTWENDYLTVYTYDSNGLLIEILDALWDSSSQTWNNYTRSTASYTSFPSPDTIVFYTMSNNNWQLRYREILRYDAYLNLYYMKSERFNGSSWEPEYMFSYYHDNTYSYSQMLIPDLMDDVYFLDESDYFNHKLDSVAVRYQRNGSWEDDYNVRLYYSSKDITRVEELWQENFKIYPNPFSDGFFVQNKKGFPVDAVYLMDLQGRIVQKWKGEKDYYKTDKVQRGMYLLQIHSGTHRMSYRVMKR